MAVFTWANGTKEYECDDCGSSSIYFDSPHGKTAGLYECYDCGYHGSCEHEDTTTETIEVDDPAAPYGTHETYKTTIQICDYCESTVDAEPETDDDFDHSDEVRELQHA